MHIPDQVRTRGARTSTRRVLQYWTLDIESLPPRLRASFLSRTKEGRIVMLHSGVNRGAWRRRRQRSGEALVEGDVKILSAARPSPTFLRLSESHDRRRLACWPRMPPYQQLDDGLSLVYTPCSSACSLGLLQPTGCANRRSHSRDAQEDTNPNVRWTIRASKGRDQQEEMVNSRQ